MTRALLLPLILLALASNARANDAEELTTAAYRDNPSAITEMLLHGVDPNLRDAKGRSALEVSLREQNERALTALLASPRLDIDSVNSVGETPLMLAAIKARLDLVQMFVKRGAQINRKGWTPLHYAVCGEDNGVSVWLIQHGADINARAPNGNTPMMMAARFGPYDLATVLLKLGADKDLRNEDGNTAADFATSVGRDPLAKKLR